MPGVYTHLTFGRSVLKALEDGAVKNAIEADRELFEIGLQGPDILFYHQPLKSDPVGRLGHGLHEKTCLSFLDREVCRNAREGGLAYLLGLICHFTLDSECHTLVEYFMGTTGRQHSALESELDRHLMVRDGLQPRTHTPASYIADSRPNADSIAPFYGLDGKTIKTALTYMKTVGKVLTPGNRAKYALLVFVTERMGKDSLPRQMIVDWKADPVYDTANRVLTCRLERAVPVAVELMEEFMRWQTGEKSLPLRFVRNFSYDEEELRQLKEGHAYV